MSKIINLLPAVRQAEIRYQAMFQSVAKIIAMSLVSFAMVILVQFGTKLYLAHEASLNQVEIEQLRGQVNKADNAKVEEQIKQLNGLISDYVSLATAQPKWSKVLLAFTVLPPPGVSINSMTIDPPSKNIIIGGFAPTRDLVIQLYNNILADNQEFYNIDYPLENVALPNNINFHFSFKVRDQLLK